MDDEITSDETKLPVVSPRRERATECVDRKNNTLDSLEKLVGATWTQNFAETTFGVGMLPTTAQS